MLLIQYDAFEPDFACKFFKPTRLKSKYFSGFEAGCVSSERFERAERMSNDLEQLTRAARDFRLMPEKWEKHLNMKLFKIRDIPRR